MHFRRLLLRVMLWSLAIAAVLGAVAILTSTYSIIGRVAGTTAITASAAGLLMVASWRMDKPNGRASGLLGMAAVLVSFFFSLLLVWDLYQLLPATRPAEAAGFTTAFALICGGAAMILLELRYLAATRIAATVALALDAIIFAVLMIPSWTAGGVFVGHGDDWFGSAGAMASLGLVAALCLIKIDTSAEGVRARTMRLAQIIGTAAAAIALLIALYAIWRHIHSESALFTSFVVVACVVAHANVCLLVPLTPAQNLVRIGTIAATVVTGMCVIGMSAFGFNSAPESLMRIAGAAGFAAACGSLALLILARINRRMNAAVREYSEASELTLTCPGCRQTQTLVVGSSHCPNCRLGFEIRIVEPRCVKCNYLLFMLKSNRCPECGAPISADVPG